MIIFKVHGGRASVPLERDPVVFVHPQGIPDGAGFQSMKAKAGNIQVIQRFSLLQQGQDDKALFQISVADMAALSCFDKLFQVFAFKAFYHAFLPFLFFL
jgi:hypothetical protein